MSDPRYNTARWQRLREAVIARDGGVCQIQGPGCTVVATTCDHIHPVSTHPHLFWEPGNLRGACRKCNYGGANRIARANARQTVERLQAVIQEQEQQIAVLLEALEDASPRCVSRRSTRGLM
jgi:5-methylcytosine-specific restriction endonuclease McrA